MPAARGTADRRRRATRAAAAALALVACASLHDRALASVAPSPAPPPPLPGSPGAPPPAAPALPDRAPPRAPTGPGAGGEAVVAPPEPVERRTLPGGARLVVERRPGAARVFVEVGWPGGVASESPDRAGATAVVAAAIEAACLPVAGQDGGSLAAYSGRRHLAVRGSWPAAAWRDGLRTARACPASPAVDEELVLARERVSADQRRAARSPSMRAAALATGARWGTYPLGLDPRRPVGALAVDGVRQHRATLLTAAPVIVLVGDVDVDEAAAALAATGDAEPVASPGPARPLHRRPVARAALSRPPAPPAPPPHQLFAELPGAGAALAVALPEAPTTEADRAALDVLAALLVDPTGPLASLHAGGSLSAAVVDAAPGRGLVLVLSAPPPLATRAAALSAALAALATGPGALDVARARERLLARLARADLRAAALARATLAGVADPATALAAVDAAAVARVATAVLRWDAATIATVQPPARTPAVDRLREATGRRHRPGRATAPVRAHPRPRAHAARRRGR